MQKRPESKPLQKLKNWIVGQCSAAQSAPGAFLQRNYYEVQASKDGQAVSTCDLAAMIVNHHIHCKSRVPLVKGSLDYDRGPASSCMGFPSYYFQGCKVCNHTLIMSNLRPFHPLTEGTQSDCQLIPHLFQLQKA